MSSFDDDLFQNSERDLINRINDARSSGNWLPWAALSTGLLWIGAVTGISVISIDVPYYWQQNPALVIGFGLIVVIPALLIWTAGFMGRESLRSSRANALVLEAASSLLTPSRAAEKEIERLSGRVRSETRLIDETIENAQAAIGDLAQQLSRDRSEITSSIEENRVLVEGLVSKLTTERAALSQLSETLAQHSETVTEAVPRQVQVMADAAKLAQAEVAKAESGLDARIQSLDAASLRLEERVRALDGVAGDANARTQKISQEVVELEKRLASVTQVIERAIKASDLAATAAGETAQTLEDSIANALDGAREASTFIRQETNRTSDELQKAMSRLTDAGTSAEESVRAVGEMARSNADEIEERTHKISDLLYRSASRATETAEAGLERARLRIERAATLLNGLGAIEAQQTTVSLSESGDDKVELDDVTVEELPVIEASSDDVHTNDAALEFEKDVFESDDDVVAANKNEFEQNTADFGYASSHSSGRVLSEANGHANGTELNGHHLEEPDEFEAESDADAIDAPSEVEASTEMTNGVEADQKSDDTSLSWRDLLTGIAEADGDRDDNADRVIDLIEQSGIRVDDLIRNKDGRKIAAASRRGERVRRRATRDVAGRAVERIIRDYGHDDQKRELVRRFLTVERSDALRALDATKRQNGHLPSRLAAYLILDAAIS